MPRITRADGSILTTMVHSPNARRRSMAAGTSGGPSPKELQQVVQDIVNLSAKLADDAVLPELGSDWFTDLKKFRDMLKAQAGGSGSAEMPPPMEDGMLDATPGGLVAMSKKLGRSTPFPKGTTLRAAHNVIVATVPRDGGKGGTSFEKYEPIAGGGYRRS